MPSEMQNVMEFSGLESPEQAALRNFDALLADMDFEVELELMDIGRFQFLLRRQMLMEWRSLYMALWRLALEKSFPHNAEAIFTLFVSRYSSNLPDKKSSINGITRAREYWAMLAPTGEADFSPAARHLASFFYNSVKEQRSLSLKLALHIRKIYQNIFDRLL